MNEAKILETGKRPYKLILAIVSLLTQLAFSVLFFFGVISFGGSTVGLFTSIDLLINLFSFNFVYYEIVGLVIGGLYIFVFIKLIVNLIFSIKLLKLSCFDSLAGSDTQKDALRAIVHRSGNCLFWIACFIVTAQCVYPHAPVINAVIATVLGVTVYAASRFLIITAEGNDIILSASRGVFSAIVAVITLLLLIITSSGAVRDISFGLDALLAFLQSDFNLSNETVLEIIYRNFAGPVFYIIFAVSLLRIVDILTEYLDYNNENALACSKALIYKTGIFVAVAVVVECFISGVTTPESIIAIILPHLPLVFATVALRLAFTFKNFEIKPASVPADAPAGEDIAENTEKTEEESIAEETSDDKN